MTEDSSAAEGLEQARSYLRNADPVLARLIDDRPAFDPRAWMAQLPPMDLYGALLFQVTGQQLSVLATRRILARIEALFDGHLPSPAGLLEVDPGKLREAGLSWRKVSTLRDLAERFSDGRLNPDVLSALPDEELMAELTAVPGSVPGPYRAPSLSRSSEKMSSCRATSCSVKPSRPPIGSTTSPASRRSLASPRNGGLTAAWRLATCFPPPSSRPVHPRSPRPRRSSGPWRGRPHRVAGGGGGTSSCEIWWAQLGSNQ